MLAFCTRSRMVGALGGGELLAVPSEPDARLVTPITLVTGRAQVKTDRC